MCSSDLWDFDTKKFKIPSATPDGEYLLRIEHSALHGAHDGQAEFYYTCAQVQVTGGGSGSTGPTVKIPGVYKRDSPEVNFSIWNNPKSYPFVPGVEVWSEGTVVGSANGKTGRAVTSGTGSGGSAKGGSDTGNAGGVGQSTASNSIQPKPSTTFSTKVKNISTSTTRIATTAVDFSALPISETVSSKPASSVAAEPTHAPGLPGQIAGKKYICYEDNE